MGGSALRHTPTRRIDAREYQQWVQALGEVIGPLVPRWAAIPAYRTKPDFGDIDILIERPFDDKGRMTDQLWAAMVPQFHADELVRNGDVWSWGGRWQANDEAAVQVDFIFAKPGDFDASLRYFSWNDLGNLMGRVAHTMELTYGHLGLLLPVRSGTHLLDKVVVTQDMDQAAEFLGYAPSPLHAGFDTLEEMYAYAASSALFTKEMFTLEHRSHTARTRDRKRASYRGFLEWIHSRPLPEHDWSQHSADWVSRRLAEAFPQAWVEAEALRERASRIQAMRPIIGGGWLGPAMGLAGKELGGAVDRLRDHATMEQWWTWWQQEGTEAVRARALGIAQAVRDKTPPLR